MSDIRDLPVREQNFVNEFLLHGNASAAYRATFECTGMPPENISQRANNLKKRSDIAEILKIEKSLAHVLAYVTSSSSSKR